MAIPDHLLPLVQELEANNIPYVYNPRTMELTFSWTARDNTDEENDTTHSR